MDGMELEEPSSSKGPVKREYTVSNTGMQFGDHCSTNIHGSVNVLITNTPEPPQKKPRIEFEVQDPIQSFTGREDILETLHKTIQESKSKERVTVLSKAKVVTGMGGLGKTETIRKYVFDYKDLYGHTLWINAETYSQAKDCFRKIATLCQVSSENFDTRRSEILDEIYDHVCQKPCLLIFDNAESMGTAHSEEGIRPFLPNAAKTGWVPPVIVVTSRNRAWGQAGLIELPGLNDNECFALLTSLLELPDTEENHFRPGLVVQQVIAIIRDTREEREVLALPAFTMQNFLSDFHDDGRDFTDTMPADSPVSSTAFQIFKMAFDRIRMKENGETAFLCLSVMALLNPDNIPAKLVMSLIAPMTTDLTTLSRALKMLRNQNLVTMHAESYRIHRVIQRVAVLYNNSKCENSAPKKLQLNFGLCYTTVDILTSIIPHFVDVLKEIRLNDNNLNEVLQNGVKIASHLKNHSEVEGIISFLEALAEKLNSAAKYSEAENIWEDLLQAYARGKPTSAEKGNAKSNLAWACLQQGKLDAALKIYKEVLEAQELELGPHHEVTLATKCAMAIVYKEQGKYDDAIELYEFVLNNKEIKFGGNDSRLITVTKSSLAIALTHMGKYKRAIELHKDVLKYYELQLGPNHPLALSTKHNLAGVLRRMGKYNEAVKMFEDTLQRRESELGQNHTDTLMTKSSLANALKDKGEDQRAFQIYETTLKAQMTHLGPDHTHTLTTKHNFSMLHAKLGKYNNAVEMLEDVLQRRESVLGPDYPSTIHTKDVLADSFYDTGEYERASELYEEVLKFQDSSHGSNSPTSLPTKSRLAYSFTKIEKYGAAIEIYQQIQEHEEKSLGPNHPDTLRTKHDMAYNLRKQGRYDEALRYCDDILNSLKQDPDINYQLHGAMGIKDEKARVFAYQGKYKDAVELFEEVLEHYTETLGENHFFVRKTEQRLRKAREKKAIWAEELDRNFAS